MPRFACSNCNQIITTPAGTEGRTGNCPGCGRRLKIPGGTALARPVPPPRLLPPTTLHPIAPPPPPPPARENAHAVPYRRQLWLALAGAGVFLLLAGCAGLLVAVLANKGGRGAGEPQAGGPKAGKISVADEAEDRDLPKGDVEELVAAWVRQRSEDPARVKFVRWGPHQDVADVRARFVQAGIEKELAQAMFDPVWGPLLAADLIVRVKYLGLKWGDDPNGGNRVLMEATFDALVPVRGREVFWDDVYHARHKENLDHWREDFDKRLCSRFPALTLK